MHVYHGTAELQGPNVEWVGKRMYTCTHLTFCLLNTYRSFNACDLEMLNKGNYFFIVTGCCQISFQVIIVSSMSRVYENSCFLLLCDS